MAFPALCRPHCRYDLVEVGIQGKELVGDPNIEDRLLTLDMMQRAVGRALRRWDILIQSCDRVDEPIDGDPCAKDVGCQLVAPPAPFAAGV